MLNYVAMKRELPKLRAALTRAKNSGDPQKVVDAVDLAFARFDVIGYPDSWHTWNIAKSDAEWKIANSWQCEDCGAYVPNHTSLCPCFRR